MYIPAGTHSGNFALKTKVSDFKSQYFTWLSNPYADLDFVLEVLSGKIVLIKYREK